MSMQHPSRHLTPAAPAHVPAGGRLITPITLLLAVLVGVAGYVLWLRLSLGLGAVTNINDGYPWGIWIAYDVVVGTALACGGYAVALVVYILNKGEYHPLVRPALLASAFGYTLGGASVIIDLGRWWSAWHIFWPGYAQVNSVMFEVALCVAAYVLVLWIEFTPVFLEKLGLRNARKSLSKVLFVFIALGVLLPTLHQSSLGTLLVLFGQQIHPLWQTPLLPLLFLTSALAMGFAVVVFEATLAARNFRRPADRRLLAGITRFGGYAIALFLVLRFADVTIRGQLGLLVGGDRYALMFTLETVLFAIPLVFLLSAESRRSPRKMFIGACCLLAGGALYRIDAYLVAYLTGAGWSYFPSLPELLVTFGIIAAELLGYILFVKYLPVLHAAPAR